MGCENEVVNKVKQGARKQMTKTINRGPEKHSERGGSADNTLKNATICGKKHAFDDNKMANVGKKVCRMRKIQPFCQ